MLRIGGVMASKAYRDRLLGQLFALLKRANVATRADRMQVVRYVLALPAVTSTTQLDIIQLEGLVKCLDDFKRSGNLAEQCELALTDERYSA